MTCFHAAAIYMVTTVSVGFRPTETEAHKQDGAFASRRIDSRAIEAHTALFHVYFLYSSNGQKRTE